MNIKAVQLITIISLVFSFISCGDSEEEKAMRKFYLLQDRDDELVGWWEIKQTEEDAARETRYWEFRINGELHSHSRRLSDEKLFGQFDEYWYTKGDTLNLYNYNKGWAYGSWESKRKYAISQDGNVLFISTNGLEPELKEWGIRATPQE